MQKKEQILSRLWDDYRDRNIRIDADPKDLKRIASIFYSGMMAMAKEFAEFNFEFSKAISEELDQFNAEIRDEDPD